jgi:hypothetical protein
MSNTIADALARGPQAAAHITKTPILYPHVMSGALTLRKSQAAVLHRRKSMNIFNASTLPADGLQNSSFTDIRLSGADIVAGVTLRMTYANNTGAQLADWHARHAYYLFDRIDVLAENGSVVVETITPEHLSKSWLGLPPAAHERVKQALQYGPGDVNGNPAPLSDATSRTIYFPLNGTVLQNSALPPYALAAPLILRCYFRGAASFVGPFTSSMVPSGTAGLSITGFDAVVTTYQHDASERADLARRYAEAGVRSPCLDIRFARPGVQRTQENIVEGLNTIRLSSVQGLVTSMSVVLQRIYAAGYGYGLYGTPTKVDLLDEKGSSLYGQPLEFDLLQATQEVDMGSVVDDNLEKIASLPIGGSSGEAAGQLHGYIPMSGHHQIQLSASPGAYTVSIIYRTASVIRIEKAHITVHSS